MVEGIEKCDCCKKNKRDTKIQKLNNHFFNLCEDCIEELKWTQTILRSGTDWIVQKHPDKYIKTSAFSVNEV